jgi:hypothetical protein
VYIDGTQVRQPHCIPLSNPSSHQSIPDLSNHSPWYLCTRLLHQRRRDPGEAAPGEIEAVVIVGDVDCAEIPGFVDEEVEQDIGVSFLVLP